MKNLIDKITNKDRLIKLYGCSECEGREWYVAGANDPDIFIQSFGQGANCQACNGKGYTINRDSQVLDIVDALCEARFLMQTEDDNKTDELRLYHLNKDFGIALIKLIELAYEEDRIDLERDLDDSGHKQQAIDSSIFTIIASVIPRAYLFAIECLLSFCNHHKIDIWQSVKEILESEG